MLKKYLKRTNNIKYVRLIILIFLGFSILYFMRNTIFGLTIQEDIYKCPDCNVILISIDALRADHLGSYGYYRNTSPNIDKLAETGILFKKAITSASYTEPAHMSILTSLYPSMHQVIKLEDNISFGRLDNSKSTLTEILKDHGYFTAAFVDLVGYHGFERGFATYSTPDYDNYKELSAEEMIGRVLHWLNRNKDNKFFIFIHLMDVHHPYTPPEPFDDLYDEGYDGNLTSEISIDLLQKINNKEIAIDNKDLQHIIAMYDGEISYTDTHIGVLLNELKRLDLEKNTIVILTADHGEEFGEHGFIGWHGHTLYEELLHIPLIIKHPFLSKSYKINKIVRSIDIMPTILDTLDITINKETQGFSLLPLTEEDIDLFTFSESGNLKSVNTGKYKFIYDFNTKKEELYGLEVDPLEKENIAEENPEISSVLKKKLFDSVGEDKGPYQNSKNEIDKRLIERLKALGYLV